MKKYILSRIKNWQAYILHMLEAKLPPEEFKYARTVILKSMGDNGLKGDIDKYFKKEGEQNDN